MSVSKINELDTQKEMLEAVKRAPVTYMLRCEDWYKIGFTHNLESRVEAMRTGNPFPIHLVYAIQTERYKELEESLHFFFTERDRYREWFKLLPEDEERFERFVIKYLCQQESSKS